MSEAALELMRDIANFYDDPLGYVMYIFPWDSDRSIQQVKLESPWKERFGCEWGPDVWACEFLDELGAEIRERGFNGRDSVAPIRFSTASGHGIGKSALVAWLIKFVLDTRPYAKGMVTANTSEQLRTKTWAELGKWHKMSLTAGLYNYTAGKGSMVLARKGFEGRWRCDGTTCREENSEAFQGLHAAESTPFYIFDEASGIPESIWKARAGGATDGEPMSFDFGNPTRNVGMFYENSIGSQKHRYVVRNIDSRSVQITNKALMQEWVDDFGEESDFVKVKVRGLFPSQSSVQFISGADVDMCSIRPLPVDRRAPFILGVDVARFGDDNTVLYPRVGYDARSFPYREYNGLDNVQVSNKVVEMIEDFRALGKECSALFIDGGSMGGGVIDILRQLGYNPIEIQFGSSATDRRYRLRGDDIWGKMRDGFKNLCLPVDDSLRNQLIQREYGFTNTGKIQLESKKDIKSRGGDSPDIADALALTFASPVNRSLDVIEKHTYIHEYDPLAFKG